MTEPIHPEDQDQPLPSSSGYRSLKDGDLANPLSLDEFFGALGPLMQLPPKEPEEPEQPKRTRRPPRLVLPAVAVVLAAFVALLRFGRTEGAGALPPGLAGRWVTDAPRYADRGLEFLPDRVLFQTGANPGDVTVHLITRIRTRQVGDTTMVTLSYLEAGASHEFAFKYAAVPEPGVRFAHQDLVWRPAGAAR